MTDYVPWRRSDWQKVFMSTLSFAVIASSLNPDSRSYSLAEEAQKRLLASGFSVTLVDLRKLPLPAFDDSLIYADENLRYINEVIRNAHGVILAVPVYNWAVGSAAKNLIEATGSTDHKRGLSSSWFDQIVTFLVSGGVPQSYTAHMSVVSSLMLDFKCVVNPYHVFATARDWTEHSSAKRLLTGLKRHSESQLNYQKHCVAESINLGGRSKHQVTE
jgi:chromate reductase, NAD(P)H dehydrogenase (quinone)